MIQDLNSSQSIVGSEDIQYLMGGTYGKKGWEG